MCIPAAGCSGTSESTETVTVEREVVPAKPAQKPKKQRRKSDPRPSPPAYVNCDPNIQAKAATTTCPFAQNTFWTYWTSDEASTPLEVWSPAAQASFVTSCEGDGTHVVCATSDNGVVRFSQVALDRYSQAQADSYASNHDLGPDPYEGLPLADTEPPPAPEVQDCQGYEPCIAPGGDVDCAGGSGDGPRYVSGPLDVNGADPYGLDDDHDGVGCEYG